MSQWVDGSFGGKIRKRDKLIPRRETRVKVKKKSSTKDQVFFLFDFGISLLRFCVCSLLPFCPSLSVPPFMSGVSFPGKGSQRSRISGIVVRSRIVLTGEREREREGERE